MSRTFKRKLLALVAIGLIVAAAGYALGGSTTINWVNGRPSPLKLERHRLQVTEQLQFKNLDVSSSVGEVRIKTGSSFSIDASYDSSSEVKYELVGDTLRVYDDGQYGFFTTGFGIVDSSGNHIDVVIPESVTLGSAKITSDVGDVYVYGIKAGTLTARTDVGELVMQNVTVDELSTSGAVGLQGEAEISSDVGRITLTDVDVSKRLTVRGDVGSVIIKGALLGETNVTTDVGTINITTTLPADQYSYDLRSDIGSVRQPIGTYSGEHRITARSSIGSISVSSSAN